MALQRLTESAIIDRGLIKNIEFDSSMKEKLDSINASHGRMFEGLVLSEKKTVWEVPISRYDFENANGRIYPRSLWERVLNDQRHIWEGAPMLSDHPIDESDGSTKDICGVWVDARLDEDGYVYGKVILSGTRGKELAEHLSNGLRAGTSSSGFGELAEDKKTVDPKTYMIERLSDWVLTPSQGTYFSFDARKETIDNNKNVTDSRMGESVKLSESAVKEKKTMGDVKISKLEERKFRKTINEFLEDATKITNPSERLKEYDEILSYFDDGIAIDLKEAVLNKINEEKEAMEKAFLEMKAAEETFGTVNTKEIEEGLTRLAQDAEVLKEEVEDYKKLSEVLQQRLIKVNAILASRPTATYVEHLQAKIKSLYTKNKKDATEYRKALGESKAKYAEMEKEFEELTEAYRTVVETSNKEIASLKEMTSRLQVRALAAEKKVVETTETENKIQEKKEQNIPYLSGKKPARNPYLMDESAEINSYWKDLVESHGESISAFEEDIRGCKTLKEAINTYIKLLPEIDGMVVESARIPESMSISRNSRQKMLEEAGMKIADSPDLIDRMPDGWK